MSTIGKFLARRMPNRTDLIKLQRTGGATKIIFLNRYNQAAVEFKAVEIIVIVYNVVKNSNILCKLFEIYPQNHLVIIRRVNRVR